MVGSGGKKVKFYYMKTTIFPKSYSYPSSHYLVILVDLKTLLNNF